MENKAKNRALSSFDTATNTPPSRLADIASGIRHAVIPVLLAATFAAAYSKSAADFERATLDNLVAFEAETPFQYRVLVPLAAGALQDLVPGLSTKRAVVALVFLSAITLFLVFRQWLIAAYSEAQADKYWLLLPLLMWNYVILNGWLLPYDIPGVMFAAVCLYAANKGKFPLYYGAFILGALNRETIAFMTLFFVVWNVGRMPKMRMALHVAAQAAIWLGVKAAIYQAVPAKGSGLFEWQMTGNIETLSRMGPPTFMVAAAFAPMVLLIMLGWGSIPSDVRRGVLASVPVILALSMFGVLWEVRIYGEILPMLALAASAALIQDNTNRGGAIPGRGHD